MWYREGVGWLGRAGGEEEGRGVVMGCIVPAKLP